MFDKRDRQIVSVLRENARMKVLHIAELTGIPSSTVHERLVKLQKRGLRMVSLPEYRQFAVPLVCWAVVVTKDRDRVREILRNNGFVNTLLETNNGADFLCECVFPGFAEQHTLEVVLREYGRIEFYPMIEVVGREQAQI